MLRKLYLSYVPELQLGMLVPHPSIHGFTISDPRVICVAGTGPLHLMSLNYRCSGS